MTGLFSPQRAACIGGLLLGRCRIPFHQLSIASNSSNSLLELHIVAPWGTGVTLCVVIVALRVLAVNHEANQHIIHKLSRRSSVRSFAFCISSFSFLASLSLVKRSFAVLHAACRKHELNLSTRFVRYDARGFLFIVFVGLFQSYLIGSSVSSVANSGIVAYHDERIAQVYVCR